MPEEPMQTVDGITPPAPEKKPEEVTAPNKPNKEVLSRAKFVLVVFFVIPYLLYVTWSFFLLAVLPDSTGGWDSFIPLGKLVAMIGAISFVLVGAFGVMRIGKSGPVNDNIRYAGLARVGFFILPGLLISGFVPYWIVQEPSLALLVTSPPANVELVAPLSITFSAEEATDILKRKGLQVKSYQWDFNSDGEVNEETVTPQATAYFDRQGGYNVAVTLRLNDGSSRRLSRRVVIPNAVFSYTPFVPVVDEPIRFSVAHLVPESRDVQVREVQWDFNEDGIPDETGSALETTHTFLRTGDHKVSVTIFFTNQTQNNYFRTLSIREPLPNPFPVSIETTPDFLESPAPFQVVFRLETQEPLQEVKWDFDDNSPEEVGQRIGHTFRDRRVYQVKAYARNLNGEISKATQVVKVVENLVIPDLSYEGTHSVTNNAISAEAPVSISLTPTTTVPLIDFWWEPERATQVTSTDTTLKAVYRDPGNYNLVLLAKDAEGRVMRRVITLEVRPKSQFVDFEVRPIQPVAPELVKFDASATYVPGDEITGFIWDFGDGEESTQRFSGAREEFEYTKAGEYTVTLTINTLSGRTESATKTITVRAPILNACFNMSRNKIKQFGGVLFDWKCSTGVPDIVRWDFGDGSKADSLPGDIKKEVDHIFEEKGEYTVELYMEDRNGSISRFTQSVIVE